jgi:uncharacterized protein
MARKLLIYTALLFVLSISNQAPAQVRGDLMNMFTAIMGAAIVNNARIEWSRVPANQTACIEEKLRQQSTSIGGLIQNGIVPNDPRIAGVRFECRTAAFSPSNVVPNAPVATENLSKRPTFNCSKAQSLTARTMCLDQAGASTDWDLITAYWARYFALPEGQRQGFDQAQQDWLISLNQGCPAAQNPRECVLMAYQRRAAAYRSQLVGDALAETRLTPEQHAKIQQSLIAFGLLEGEADGEFGSITRSAIRRLNAQTGDIQSDFLTANQRAELLQGKLPGTAQVASSQSSCRVADPTGTPLNVRTTPNGTIVDTLIKGTPLQVVGTQQDSRGREWALIKRSGDAQAVGWAFRDFLDCTKTAEAPSPPVPSPPAASPPSQPAQPPRIETARLKEARIFLEDTKKFIGQQKSVPSISEVAEEAAALQTALNQFDERGAVESKQKLDNLLKPIPGFTEFVRQQQAERNREEARLITEGRIQAKRNEHFIDTFLQGHLGGSATQPLLSLRGKIENAVKSNTLEELKKANDVVASYVNNNALADAYAKIVEEFGHEPTPPKTSGTLRDSLTAKSKFLLDGPADEIILLYNASSGAPKVWKNVRGDVVFQDEAAAICFAQPEVELGVVRYLDHYLADRRARKVTSVAPPCDLANAGKTIDIIAFRRGELLKGREDYVLALAKMLEGDTFRPYETIKNYTSEMQKRQERSLKIEADLDSNSLSGFGVISVTDIPLACVVPPKQPDRGDGLKELLKRNADVIAPTLTAEWRYVDTGTNDLAFLGL